ANDSMDSYAALQAQPAESAYPHSNIVYTDSYGNFGLRCSRSSFSSCQTALIHSTIDDFLRPVALSGELCWPHCHALSCQRQTPVRKSYSQQQVPSASNQANDPDAEGYERKPVPLSASYTPTNNIAHGAPLNCVVAKTRRHPKKKFGDKHQHTFSNSQSKISIRDRDMLQKYYEKAFENLQQRNCRVLAKAYVKLVEPRKQVNYPYNGRKVVAGTCQQFDPEMSKPPWWPSGVRHREPDHILKHERIKLLTHILCELHISHGITVEKLRGAELPIRRLITPADRLQILEEVYRVRQQEVDFLERKTDGQTPVWICRTNLPEAEGATNHNYRNAESGGFDAVCTKISNTAPAVAKPSSRAMDAPMALFAAVGDVLAISSLNRQHYSVRDQILRNIDPTVSVSRPLHSRNKRRENAETAGVVTTRPVVLPQDFYSSTYHDTQSFGGDYGLLQQPNTVHATTSSFPGEGSLAQPMEAYVFLDP
ncbi:hypothetical protein N7522_002674, partial [Penicillium canescens]